VNLIGDHTDYSGGLVLPMTIDRWTTVSGTVSASDDVELTSTAEHDVGADWVRYVDAVAAEIGPSLRGITGRITSSVPIGAGLSSRAALQVASALALGFDGNATEIAELARRAEHRASGVPCGIMDQLCVAAGVTDHALLIDSHTLEIEPVRLPDDCDVIVRFVERRALAGTEHADRVAQCAAAEETVGPLRMASLGDLDRIDDPVVRRRARHVITENQRVRDFAAALRAGQLGAAGLAMLASHASLRDDFETSTPAMNDAVVTLAQMPSVFGARLTGGGFGGCVVALAERGAVTANGYDTWVVRAVAGAVNDAFNRVAAAEA
jgi:galactokinase